MKVLIEGAVGAVRFTSLVGGDSQLQTGSLLLGGFSLVGAAVLMNMEIAKINSSYNQVSRRGKLFYYKELFDLRYLYKLDPEFGFLMSMEHPFSLSLLPSLCCLKCLQRRTKRERAQRTSEAVFSPAQFLAKEKQTERISKKSTGRKWRCCGCVKCEKVSPRRGIQL